MHTIRGLCVTTQRWAFCFEEILFNAQEKQNDLAEPEGESQPGSVTIVNTQPLQLVETAASHNKLPGDPSATIHPDPQLNCLADQLHDESSSTSPILVTIGPQKVTTTPKPVNQVV